eukprot:Em0003g798a
MLRKYIQEKKEKWDDYLDTCTFAYNTSRHESTKFTPFEIMFGRKAILPLDLDAGVHQGPCNEAEVTICSQETEIQQKESQHKALLEEVQKNIISAQKKQKEQYDKKHSKAVFYSAGTHVLKKDFRKKKRKGGKLDFPWVGPYLITRSLGKGFYELQSCEKGRVTTIPRSISSSRTCFYLTISCVSVTSMDETTLALSPTAKDSASAVLQESNHTSELETSSLLQSPSASNESHSTPSPGRNLPSLGPTSTSRSAVSLSPTMDETTVALSPTAKDSASAVLQESNHTSELETSSLLSEKPKLLIPTPEFFPRGDGTRSKRECNTKTKRVAKLMRQNSKKMTVPCQPAVEVESYVPLAQDEVQHWVPGLTTEDKKMITSGGWLSDEIVDAGQKLLKSMYPHIQGLQEVALGMVLSYSIAKSEFIQIMNTGKHHWVTVSNINCNDEEIHVYDCASGSPTSSLLNQIASIVCTPKDMIKLTYVDVQMQQGCDDCGLFAIAFATSLARGEQPGSFFYQQKAMRKHLVDCLEKQNITAFPIQKIRRHGSKAMNLSLVSIFIFLRLFGLGRSDNCGDCPNYGTILTCDPQTCDRNLLNGYWVGNVTDGGQILVGLCLLGYCLYNESGRFIQIPYGATQTMGDFLCNDTRRMGILCGQCQPGNAPAINSGTAGYATDCVPCDGQSSKINWVYYLLSIYVPLLVVFLVIIVFNIRLTTGPMNSFILFAQVISSTLDINQQGAAPLNVVYGKGTTAFEKSYLIPYNLFNLNLFGNLFPPFCLHENMSSSDVLVLRYAEGFFPVLIIVVILLLLRCQRCARLPSFCGHHRTIEIIAVLRISAPNLTSLLVQQVIIIVYIFLLSVLKPYKDNRLNILDVVIFTDMALINILTWFTIDTTFQTDPASLSACIIMESILVFLPMVYLVAILLWYCTSCHEGASEKMKKWRDTMIKRLPSWAGNRIGSPLPPLSSFEVRSEVNTAVEYSLQLERDRSL